MKLKYLLPAIAGLTLSLTLFLEIQFPWKKLPAPEALAEVTQWQPSAMQTPAASAQSAEALPSAPFETISITQAPEPPQLPAVNLALPTVGPAIATWSGTLSAGETLDSLLAQADLSASDRTEVAFALSAEYDLRMLKPGYGIEVESSLAGALKRVVLSVDAGVQIEVMFEDEIATRKIVPETYMVPHAVDATVQTSISATLASANVPARFAVDLAEMLGGTVDFRRDLKGGEELQLMWREAMLGDEVIGRPSLSFAALTIEETTYEVVWPEDNSGNASIFIDGELLRVFAQPVKGARLSSAYGNRRHPVFGDMRMHTGVDFAAPYGTSVYATAPGRISFIGRRGGYGRVVEIAHGSDTETLYAHLGSVPDGLAVGDRVAAGDIIGGVGSTGTVTGPNLHYEVRVDGRPTDPMAQERLAAAARQTEINTDSLANLEKVRAQFSGLLERNLAAVNPGRM